MGKLFACIISAAIKRGKVIVGDSTYLRMRCGGFCYLATPQEVMRK